MSNFIDKIKALITEEEPAPPAPAQTAPPEEPPVQTTPPAEPPEPEPQTDIQAQINTAMEAHNKELQDLKEKLKGIQSSSTPPPPVTPEPVSNIKDGLDLDRWHEEINKINKVGLN